MKRTGKYKVPIVEMLIKTQQIKEHQDTETKQRKGLYYYTDSAPLLLEFITTTTICEPKRKATRRYDTMKTTMKFN